MKCKIWQALVLLSALGLFLPNLGCSVGMALSGKKDPNLGAVRVGATRGEVEMLLGNPVSSVTTEEGKRVDIYEYEIGNEPSGGRAVGHAVMDVLTLGIWEIIGTPIEAVQGKKYQVSISYDPNNRVLAINQPISSLPTANKDVTKTQQTATIDQAQQPSPKPKIESKPHKPEVAILEDKLDHIEGLRNKGKITEVEYRQMRKDIIGSVSQSPNKPPSPIPAVTPKKPIIVEEGADE